MPNTALNRTTVALLTNKSGGALVYGDVVVLDNTNAKGFTTTTTSALSTRGIGVILEPNGIANNATGLVALSGWIPKINLNTAATVGQFIKTHTVAGQGTPHSSPQGEGDFGCALQASATPEAILFGTANPPGAAATPGGSNTQVQYNNAGALGGITGATTDGTTLTLVAPVLGTPASGTLTNNVPHGPASYSVLTTGTAATYTVPAGIYRLRVRVQGGGGAGGGAAGTTGGAGAGGGGGGYAEKTYSVTPGQTFTYTIGGTAAGVSGNATGTAGNASTFDSGGLPVVGNGGGGGGSMATGSGFTAADGGTGGTGTGGDVNIAGGYGSQVLRSSASVFSLAGGGNAVLGKGGKAAVNATAASGTNYGGGGGAPVSSSGVASQTSGGGAQGVIIVEEYN